MPPELIIKRQGEPLRRLSLTQESITLGRDPACEVVLASSFVSRRHARIERRGGRFEVVDEGSRNGVFVNGARVDKRAPLRKGDEIAVADFLLTYWEADGDDVTQTFTGAATERLIVDAARREVWLGVQKLDLRLSAQEWDLLALLYEGGVRVFDHQTLGDRVWGSETVGGKPLPKYDENMIHRLVFRLRAKLRGATGRNWIVNVPGVGYRLDAE